MNPKTMLEMVVGVAVGILILSACLIPQIDSSTDQTLTYRNEGVPYALASSDDLETHTIVVTADGITVDGDPIDGSILPGSYTIVFGEHSILRYDPTDGRVVFGGSGEPGGTSYFSTIRSGSSSETLTVTISGDLLTAVNGETTTEIEDQWAYISQKGDYRYCVNPCVTATDRIIGGGVTYSPFTNATVICFDGTIDDIDAAIVRSNPAATLNDVTVNTTEITTNLVKIDSIVFDCTQSDTDKTATYTYFLAPYEIVYNNPNYVGEDLDDLFAIIPVLITVGLIMGIVGVVAARRFE